MKAAIHIKIGTRLIHSKFYNTNNYFYNKYRNNLKNILLKRYWECQ